MKRISLLILTILVLLVLYVFYSYGLKIGFLFVIGLSLLFLLIDFQNNIYLFKKHDVMFKILDISFLSDPRSTEIISTGFIGRKFIIPKSVIEELQKNINSNNEKIKTYARKVLDLIARLKENDEITIKIESPKMRSDNQKDEAINIAKEKNCEIVTFDYDMTKLGIIKNVKVLNINELILSLRQSFLPGDEMSIFVVREGKEKGQGVGYLDDGTMVVVENGYSYIGKKVDVTVQSVLKTSNGRIVFTKIK